ncbi:CPSF A subunit region-domain-containing protein [Cladochytrium replicatum]|nr:CPSF A subunit region-domain-containing protein [Cladochytrium replicatum]
MAPTYLPNRKDRPIPAMFLNNLTLQSATHINLAVAGNFSGSRQQEILVARNSVLELLKPDDYGKLNTLLSHEIFGLIRGITPFRLTGAAKDYIVVASDSGRIVILEYNPTKNVFEKVHQETYGKSGCRRIVPGQYIAADPKGRAVMIGAVEKQKLVYILNRDAAAKLTISSPLEAHKSSTIVHHIVGVDVGFDNPIFASVEVDYSEADADPTGEAFQNTEKLLVYYELDLGLNHVVRKWSSPVDTRSNMLITVPGGADGPSGVLVCSENFITWRHIGHKAVRIPIPRRPDPLQPQTDEGDDSRGIIIVASVMHKLKRGGFFILVQTEEGDVFKVTMEYELVAAPDGSVTFPGGVKELKIKYFDTVPVANALCVLKNGSLFVASEFGNHCLYQIGDLGEDEEDQLEYSSSDFPEPPADFGSQIYFRPRGLRNLNPVDELESLSPLVDAKVLNLSDEDMPQIYALCGRGARSSFRILRHGLEVTEIGVSELPGNPTAVWTVKTSSDEAFDSYIVVSFLNATLVLSIGETVEEVADTGFLGTSNTITVAQLGDNALVQVYPQGIRHIRSDRRVSEWVTPGKRSIVHASCNRRQVVIALSGGELVYFELDSSGQLNEFQERREMASAVTCVAVGPVPEGKQRCRFLAVGCADNTVRIISLDPDTCLQPMSMQALNAIPESLAMVDMPDATLMTAGSTTTATITTVHIGLTNGVLLRTTLDTVTGHLTDTRLRFLGSRPVKLHPVRVQGAQWGVMALSSRPWLNFVWAGRTRLVPLSYDSLEYGSSFSSEQCPEGFVAVTGNTLRIFMVEKFAGVFNQGTIPLKYTPRRFTLHQPTKHFVVIESEHNTWCPSDKARILAQLAAEMEQSGSDGQVPEELPPDQFGLPKAEPGKWASCVRLIDPSAGETVALVDLDENEAAFSVASVLFHEKPTEQFIVVGVAKSVTLSPRACTSASLRVYKVIQNPDGGAAGLEFMHKTPIEEIPYALCPFQGRLLVGSGKVLRIYDLGKKRLLRKCEAKGFPNTIVQLHTQGDRIIVGDIQESVQFAAYRARDNRIITFADDSIPRWTTATTMIDYDTIAGGDKFGNFFVVRLPSETSEEVDDDPTGNKLIYEKGYLNGAPHKLQHLVEFHVGETITSVHKVTLVAGGREVILYTTLLGSIGVFVPFVSKEEAEFFQTLEMAMRKDTPPLCGRDHLSYRSSYVPVRNCVDGNLVERFMGLTAPRRRAVAEELDRTPMDVSKKVEDARNRAAF